MVPRSKKAFAMATLLGSLLLSACSVFGIRDGTEEPRHSLVERLGDVEIRRYTARLAAETTVPGDATAARGEGFRRLAGYIFGGNQGRTRIEMTAPVAQSGERIAMTAPVAQTAVETGWVIRFFLPAGLTDAPQPNDDRVRIVPVPAETMAVLRFSGIATDPAIATQRAALLKALAGTQWRPAGEPVSWFYDPPWTLPPLRRNEVALPVTDAAK
jgi:SOUL heme-binding protein